MKLKPTGPTRPVELPKDLPVTPAKTEKKESPPDTSFAAGKAPSKSNPLDPSLAKHEPFTGGPKGIGFETIETSGPLAQLRASGLLAVEMQLELNQKIVGEGAVDTRNQQRPVSMIRSEADLKQLDSEMAQKLGAPKWTELKGVANAWAARIDDLANGVRLPSEGIHPDFALAGKSLMKAMNGVQMTPAELKASDAALAQVIAFSPKGAAATAEVWLRQFGVSAHLAPQAFAALSAKLGPLPGDVVSLIGSAKSGAKVDGQLAAALASLSPENLLRAQHELSLAGLVSDRLTFFGANPTPKFAADFPQAAAALFSRDVRQELLAPVLANDAQYQALKAQRDQLIAGSGLPPREVEWALLQDQKLTFLVTETREGIADPATDLSARTIEKTFFDHLRARREGNLEKDLSLNYDPDLIFTSNQGNFFGHDGVRNSAANLAKLVPGREWVMNRLSFSQGQTPTEGYATEVWSAELEGRLVTAVDNFFIRDGKIAMQSAYYTEVRGDLERKPV